MAARTTAEDGGELLGRRTSSRISVRLSRTVAVAVIVAIGLLNLYWAITGWTLSDASAYWNAAIRLRDGAPLFPPLTSVEGSDVYRYSPWFAWLAVPFTYLPVQIAGAIWSVILVMASTLAVAPLAAQGRWLGIAFFWPILIGISAIGNAHPLLVCALALGVERRSGPVWIAFTASLKAFPLLFVLVYIGRRQWWRAGITLALTLLFVAPFLFYPLEHYPLSAGGAALLIAWPPVYVITVSAALVTTLLLAKTKWGWLAAATSVCLALPRFFVYDVSYLLVAASNATTGGSSRFRSRSESVSSTAGTMKPR